MFQKNALSWKFAHFNKNRIKILSLLAMCLLGTISFPFLAHAYVEKSSVGKIFHSETLLSMRNHRVGLVLGCRHILSHGQENLFFVYRMQAAAQLFHKGKVDFLIVSGDNSTHDYNEPGDMRQYLVGLGVPKERIYCDFAGFRTLDSVVRAKKVFKQSEIVIISQEFHLKRALFLTKSFQINALGFQAREVPKKYAFKTEVREYLARTKAIFDIRILRTKPKFLGEPVIISLKTPQIQPEDV